MSDESSGFAFTSSVDKEYRITAMVKSGMESEYRFVGWKQGNNIVYNDAVTTFTVTSSATDKNNPLTQSFTAHFVRIPRLSVTSSIPTAARAVISKEDNNVGDVVTLRPDLKVVTWLGNYNFERHLLVEFEAWVDDNGNVLSTDEEFTLEITEDTPRNIIMKLRDLSEQPQDGHYYRLRTGCNRVMVLEGKFNVTYSTTGRNNFVDPALIRFALPEGHVYEDFNTITPDNRFTYTDDNPPMDVEANPATVFCVSGTVKGNNMENVKIYAQGENTYDITNNYIQIKPMSDEYYGYYYLFGKSTIMGDAGIKMTLRYTDNKPGCEVLLGNVKPDDSYSAMAFQPIDEAHMDRFWFGAKPDESMLFEGGYWTSMYTGFPYECRDDVEAYYVRESVTANGITYAKLVKVEDGRVPANTAVLLKCNGLTTKENRLLPLHPDTAIPALEGNALCGVFQLYTNANREGREKYEPGNMRVLSCNDAGEVGFYRLAPLADGTQPELAANKVYLNMDLMPGVKTAPCLILTSDSGLSGTDVPVADEVDETDSVLYDLQGRRITDPEPGRIYISNERKVKF